ncbi:MAG: Gfo/Idh/MocA family protein [Phycisphaerae bacterium]
MTDSTATQSQSQNASGSKGKLRIGFIGVAGIAGQQIKSLQHRDDVEFVALCDINEEVLARRKEDFSFQQTYTDWKEMLQKAELDAVSVCTPNFLHLQPTLDAFAAGCHVMVEKPLAMNVAEGQQMVDAAKKAGKELTIGFQHRFNPKTQRIRRAFENGLLGDILYARVWALRRRGIPNWGMFVRKDLQGGGPMIDIGVHSIEMAHYAMGSPRPIAASGQTYTYLGDQPSDTVECSWKGWDYENYTVEDLATGYVRFENGATMSIEASFAAHIGPQGMDFTLMGTKGGAQQSTSTIYHDMGGYMTDSTPVWLPNNDAFRVKMDCFVDCCLYGKENQAPGEEGLMIQKILDAVYASAESGREVLID